MKSSNEFLSQVRREGSKRSEEHTSELQSQSNLVCRLLLEKKKKQPPHQPQPPAPHSPSHPAGPRAARPRARPRTTRRPHTLAHTVHPPALDRRGAGHSHTV